MPTLICLQARSDPTIRAAREFIAEGDVGTLLIANVSYFTSGVYQRGKGRIWQGWRLNGANLLTIIDIDDRPSVPSDGTFTKCLCGVEWNREKHDIASCSSYTVRNAIVFVDLTTPYGLRISNRVTGQA